MRRSEDERIARIMQGPKSALIGEDGKMVMVDGRPVLGWLFTKADHSGMAFIADMGTIGNN